MTSEIKQIDENIADAKKELIRLHDLRELAENDIVRRATLALQNDTGFSSWTSQKFSELKIAKYHTYYGECCRVIIPMGYTLFGIVQELEKQKLFITDVSTSDNEFSIIIADESCRDWMLTELRKYAKA